MTRQAPMRVVVVGASGRLGTVVASQFTANGHHVVALHRAALDVTAPQQVASAMRQLQPHVIVNCTGYNAVDAAERDVDAAFAINAHGPALLAHAATQLGATLVHYSTDFVFDGTSETPYDEDAAPNPLSVYGASKLVGEHEARATPRHYVLRVESLFGGSGVNGHQATIDYFASRLLSGLEVQAFSDRTVSPTYVVDAASATARLVETAAPYGLYHCVNAGFTSWFGLARHVADLLGVDALIAPTMATQASSGAPRPRFCALSCERLKSCGIDMPIWQDAVGRHLADRHIALAAPAPDAIQSPHRRPTVAVNPLARG